jgi:3-oxoadipate enol-lactonase
MMPVPACAERGRGSRTLVFLHGIGGNHRAFAPQLERFAGSARAIAWDMPGYGASPPLERMTFPELAQALVALLDARGAAQAVVIGHSMGGMVAQELVASFPERVAALVLYATIGQRLAAAVPGESPAPA